MDFEIIENPDKELIKFLDDKIDGFNWEVKERLPLTAQLKEEFGNIIAGVTARSFCDWLLLDTMYS